MESDEPNWTLSNTDISHILPKARRPAAEQPLPNLTKLLTEKLEPKLACDKVDMDEPNFVKDLTLIELAIMTCCKFDNLAPVWQ
jgi:hypothetical protein